MMFDSQHDAGSAQGATAFEPMERSSAAAKKSLRGRTGALLTSTALVAAASAMMAGEAGAQVPMGFSPAPADVVSYVQLSNGSVLVQLANQQSLLVTSNNFFIDGSGVLYLSPNVASGITGGSVASGATIPAAPGGMGLPAPTAPLGTTNLGQTSTGVIFDDTAAAASSGGILGTITGGPGLFGLGTLGTIAAIGLGGGAVLLAANAIRNRLNDDPDPENVAATIVTVDDEIEKGETDGSLTYAISDENGIDESDLIASINQGLAGASTISSIFSDGATVTTERSGSGLVEGTEDTYRSINVTLTGDISDVLNVGDFTGPAVSFNDAAGNTETVNFSLSISEGSGGGGNQGPGTLELNPADGSTHQIAQGGSKLFKATDPEGDTITYQISNNPSGIGIDSNTGLVVVSNSVGVGSYTITVTASSTGSNGVVDTDTETYNINVVAGGGGGNTGNTVNADFDSEGAGFNTLTGTKITNGDTASNSDDEFEVVDDSHLANSYVMDGLGGDDTLYFSEKGGTYHLDPTWTNGFDDVSSFETLVLMDDVDLEINGGVLDSVGNGDIEHIDGAGNNMIKLVNANADMGLDVTITNIDMIDTNNYDLILDRADLGGVNKVLGDTQSTLVFVGQFTYDFAEGELVTEDVTRLGLAAGNYDYSLTLDGINDEDVREIYAYSRPDNAGSPLASAGAGTSNEISGDVMIDTRMNHDISLIDLAGDQFTTGGLSGKSNIFATYDDPLQILGGTNDDDVDLILESDVEDGELQVNLGDGDGDTLNVELNGDEIDTLGFGRSIRGTEYVDIDANDGDGESLLEFWGNQVNASVVEVVDMSDVKDDSTIVLTGDLSLETGFRAGTIGTAATAKLAAGDSGAISGVGAIAEVGRVTSDAPLAAFGADDTAGADFVAAVVQPIYDNAINIIEAGPAVASFARASIIVDGWVSEDDTDVVMTEADDTVTLTIGETELDLIIDDVADATGWADNAGELGDAFGAGAATAYGVNASRSFAYLGNGTGTAANTAVAISDLLMESSSAAFTGDAAGAGANHIIGVRSVTNGNAQGSQELLVDLRGGDDTLNLTLGGAQEEEVTIRFAKANSDDFDTVNIDTLEDLAGLVAGAAETTTEGVRLDFANDINGPLTMSAAASAGAVNEVGSQHQGVIVFSGANQRGFIYDHDGDGTLSDGDTLVDLTDATGGIGGNALSINGAGELVFESTNGDNWNFQLDSGDLVDLG